MKYSYISVSGMELRCTGAYDMAFKVNPFK
jgi:hypothetical protein